MGYEKVEHTADLMIRCRADTLEECFQDAAYAMFDQMADLSKVGTELGLEVEVDGEDNEQRLYALLSELLYLHDAEMLLFKEFQVVFQGEKVRCHARGERMDPSRHSLRTEIKAVTYHMLQVDPSGKELTVIFDL
jgi:SHS2 domain-containing protein